jgi:hypothetical protein
MRLPWKPGEIEDAVKTFGHSSSRPAAVVAHNAKWKTGRTLDSIDAKLAREHLSTPQNILGREAREKSQDSAEARVVPLVRLLKSHRSRGVSELCNDLDVSPRRLEDMIALATGLGHKVTLSGDGRAVALEREAPTPDRFAVHHLPIEPVKGVISFLATSDQHHGSLHARPECLRDAVNIAYHDHGIRRVFDSGDLTDGLHVYRGQQTELLHHTMGAQLSAAAAGIPRLLGLTWDVIGGNHDESYLKDNGTDVINLLGKQRPDIRTHDYYQAMADIGPEDRPDALKVELFHPMGNVPYSRSYRLQEAINKMPGGMKPHILLAGHLHVEMTMFYRGVFAVQVPCFQDQSLLGKRMGAAPEIGAFIIKVGLTKGSAIKTINIERLLYFHSARGPVRCEVVDRNGNRDEKRFERRVALD